MRRIMYGAGCSLDGFIARSDHSVDWLQWSDDVAAISAASLAGVDTIVMGRRTYEVARRSGTSAYPGYRNIVFTRTLTRHDAGDVELVAEDAVGFVRRLKGTDGGDVCVMGGGVLAGALLEADLVDDVGLNIHPLLLGSGIPMFGHHTRRIDLELVEQRAIPHGCVYAYYRVKRPPGS